MSGRKRNHQADVVVAASKAWRRARQAAAQGGRLPLR